MSASALDFISTMQYAFTAENGLLEETNRNNIINSRAFNVKTFLKFTFSVVFLFVCCLTLTLYATRLAGLGVTLVVRAFVLSRHTYFYLGGLNLSMLHGRLFFHQFEFVNENYSIRFVDGYVTFRLWAMGAKQSNWTKLHEFMLTDALIGTRCRVAVNLSHYRGTIVAVNKAQHKVEVKLDRDSSNNDENNNYSNTMNYNNNINDVQEQLMQNGDGEEMTELPSFQHPFASLGVTVTTTSPSSPLNYNTRGVNVNNTSTAAETNRKVQLMSELRNGNIYAELNDNNNAIFNDNDKDDNIKNYYNYSNETTVETNELDQDVAEACYSPMSISSLSSSPAYEAIYNNPAKGYNNIKENGSKYQLFASEQSTNPEYGSVRERYLHSVPKEEFHEHQQQQEQRWELLQEQQKKWYDQNELNAANIDFSPNLGNNETTGLRNANGKSVHVNEVNDHTDRSKSAMNNSKGTQKYKSVHQSTSLPFATGNNGGTTDGCPMYGLDDEVIKTFDSSAIHVRSDRGCCHVHLNGLQCCVFNSTSKYRDLNLPDGPDRDGKSNRCNANNNNNNNNTINRNNNINNNNHPHYTNYNSNYLPTSEYEMNGNLQSPSVIEGNEQINENAGNWITRTWRMIGNTRERIAKMRRTVDDHTWSGAPYNQNYYNNNNNNNNNSNRNEFSSIPLYSPQDEQQYQHQQQQQQQQQQIPPKSTCTPTITPTMSLSRAKSHQQRNLASKNFLQRFFAMIGAIELECYTVTLDIGSVQPEHPYFLHNVFARGEGRIFITKEGCSAMDLHRTVVEMTLEQVDVRMAQMHKKTLEKLSAFETEHDMQHNKQEHHHHHHHHSNSQNRSKEFKSHALRARAQLWWGGTTTEPNVMDDYGLDDTPSTELVTDYGIVLDKQDKGNLHVVWYSDRANIYAGEPYDRSSLPRNGLEVLVESPRVRYGPWLEYCRTWLWQYFFPPNYRPLQPVECVIGHPRPTVETEFFVEFIQETLLEVPFKRRDPSIAPPFGIIDSGVKGLISISIAAGAQFVQPASFMLRNDVKQLYEALFTCSSLRVVTNGVLESPTLFAEMKAMQLFIDRQDDMVWNGRKLWNFLPKLYGARVYWYMCYQDFLLDLYFDWQFAENMYHKVPLSTELYNTRKRAVDEFVPNSKRFELFADQTFTLFINANTQNVIYSEEPNDFAQNTFEQLTMESGHFFMTLPSDTYQLSVENEIVRPLEVEANNLRAYLHLCPGHPMYHVMSSTIPWARADRLHIDGNFIVNVPNQAKPQEMRPIDPQTKLTLLTNYLNLNVCFFNTRGAMTATHIKYLINAIDNSFIDNTYPIRPDQLFWLLAKLQVHATTGKNKRREFKEFLELQGNVGNNLEISVNLRMEEITVSLLSDQWANSTLPSSTSSSSSSFTANTGLLQFTYVRQMPTTEFALMIAPIQIIFPRRRHSTKSLHAPSTYNVNMTQNKKENNKLNSRTMMTPTPMKQTNKTATQSPSEVLEKTKQQQHQQQQQQQSKLMEEEQEEEEKDQAFCCVGEIVLGMLRHFGRMPIRQKIHEVLDVSVDGFTGQLAMPELSIAINLIHALTEQFVLEDYWLNERISLARTVAESNAERVIRRVRQDQKGSSLFKGNMNYNIQNYLERMNESSYMNNFSFGLKSQTQNVNHPSNNNNNNPGATSTLSPAPLPTNVNATSLPSTSISAGLPFVLPFAYSNASNTQFFSSSTTTNPSVIDKQADPNNNKITNQMIQSQCNRNAYNVDQQLQVPMNGENNTGLKTSTPSQQQQQNNNQEKNNNNHNVKKNTTNDNENYPPAKMSRLRRLFSRRHKKRGNTPIESETQRYVTIIDDGSSATTSRNVMIHNNSDNIDIYSGNNECNASPLSSADQIGENENEDTHVLLLGELDHGDFAQCVPTYLAWNFANWMETINISEDITKDYGLSYLTASINKVEIVFDISSSSTFYSNNTSKNNKGNSKNNVCNTGYLCVSLPNGVNFAESTVNDDNSNRRRSAIARDVSVRGLMAPTILPNYTPATQTAFNKSNHATNLKTQRASSFHEPKANKRENVKANISTPIRATNNDMYYDNDVVFNKSKYNAQQKYLEHWEQEEFIEVMQIETSVFVRQCIAYPFDGSLCNHKTKQTDFVNNNDYCKLIHFDAEPYVNFNDAQQGQRSNSGFAASNVSSSQRYNKTGNDNNSTNQESRQYNASSTRAFASELPSSPTQLSSATSSSQSITEPLPAKETSTTNVYTNEKIKPKNVADRTKTPFRTKSRNDAQDKEALTSNVSSSKVQKNNMLTVDSDNAISTVSTHLSSAKHKTNNNDEQNTIHVQLTDKLRTPSDLSERSPSSLSQLEESCANATEENMTNVFEETNDNDDDHVLHSQNVERDLDTAMSFNTSIPLTDSSMWNASGKQFLTALSSDESNSLDSMSELHSERVPSSPSLLASSSSEQEESEETVPSEESSSSEVSYSSQRLAYEQNIINNKNNANIKKGNGQSISAAFPVSFNVNDARRQLQMYYRTFCKVNQNRLDRYLATYRSTDHMPKSEFSYPHLETLSSANDYPLSNEEQWEHVMSSDTLDEDTIRYNGELRNKRGNSVGSNRTDGKAKRQWANAPEEYNLWMARAQRVSSESHGGHNHTGFYAPPPLTVFALKSNKSLFPQYFTHIFYDAYHSFNHSHKATSNKNNNNTNAFTNNNTRYEQWGNDFILSHMATRNVTNNKPRSESGSTTRHTEFQLTDPLTILLTRETIALLKCAVKSITNTFYDRKNNALVPFRYESTTPHATQSPFTHRMTFQPFLPRIGIGAAAASSSVNANTNTTGKSRVRTQQKRWQSEDTIYSLTLPCVEIKCLSHLPLSKENYKLLVSSATNVNSQTNTVNSSSNNNNNNKNKNDKNKNSNTARNNEKSNTNNNTSRKTTSSKISDVLNASNAFSIYTTTIIIRHLQLITRKTHQPRGVEEGSGMIGNLLCGVHLQSAALITHIEHEPIRRDGSLHVKVPHIPYPSFDGSNDGNNNPLSRNSISETHATLPNHMTNAAVNKKGMMSPSSQTSSVNEFKPVIMVAFVHDGHIRGKRSIIGGTYGGECNASLTSTAFHVTKDGMYYLQLMEAQLSGLPDEFNEAIDSLKRVMNAPSRWHDMNAHASHSQRIPSTLPRTSNRYNTHSGLPPLSLNKANTAHDTKRYNEEGQHLHQNSDTSTKCYNDYTQPEPSETIFPSFAKGSETLLSTRNKGVTHYGSKIQGRGQLGSFKMFFYDTRVERRRLRIDLNEPTVLSIEKPSLNFLLIKPNWRREKHIQFQCVGVVHDLHIRLFPTILHVLEPHRTRRMQVAHMEKENDLMNNVVMSNSNANMKRQGQTMNDEDKILKDRLALVRPTRRSFVEQLTTAIVQIRDNDDDDIGNVSSSTTMNDDDEEDDATNIDIKGDDNYEAKPSPLYKSLHKYKHQCKNNINRDDLIAFKQTRFRPKIIYSCAFTINELDVSILHTEHNYVQLTGKHLSGAIESRAERENSRECVQMDVLTEAISARLKRRLREWAASARERALQSRYATPPSTSAQLELYSTASFFAGELLVHYTSDAMVTESPLYHNNNSNNNTFTHASNKLNTQSTINVDRPKTSKATNTKRKKHTEAAHLPFEPLSLDALDNKPEALHNMKRADKPNRVRSHVRDEIPVLSGVVEQVTVVVQFAEQYDQYGEQVNVHVVMQRSKLESPLRPRANETVHPQVREFLTAWRNGYKSLRKAQVENTFALSTANESPTFSTMQNYEAFTTNRQAGNNAYENARDYYSAKNNGNDFNDNNYNYYNDGNKMNKYASKWQNKYKNQKKGNKCEVHNTDMSDSSHDLENRESSFLLSENCSNIVKTRAFVCSLFAKQIEAEIGLPQSIRQHFTLPTLSCIMETSSDGRTSAKVHLHPFAITYNGTGTDQYEVVLPHIYVLYASDTTRMTLSGVAERFALTVTPLFVNHMMLTYWKFTDELIPLVTKSMEIATDETNQLQLYSSLRNANSTTRAKPLFTSTPGVNDKSNMPYFANNQPVRSKNEKEDYYISNSDVFDSNKRKNKRKNKRYSRNTKNYNNFKYNNPFYSSYVNNSDDDDDVNEDQQWKNKTDNEELENRNENVNNTQENNFADSVLMKETQHRRSSILFLLGGLRGSFLTSMTNLRLSIRDLNAIADSAAAEEGKRHNWLLNVRSAQLALVDRDDYDTLMRKLQHEASSAIKQRSAPSSLSPLPNLHTRSKYQQQQEQETNMQPWNSSPPWISLPIHNKQEQQDEEEEEDSVLPGYSLQQPSSSSITQEQQRQRLRGKGVQFSEDSIASNRDKELSSSTFRKSKNSSLLNTSLKSWSERQMFRYPLGGYVWGSIEFSCTLSGGRLDEKWQLRELQESNSFTSYTPQMQRALLDTLGRAKAQWKLSLTHPLIILRFGLPQLLKECITETQTNIDEMKSATAKEKRLFSLRLLENRSFRKLQEKVRRHEILMEAAARRRRELLEQMTVEVAHYFSQRRGAVDAFSTNVDEDAALNNPRIWQDPLSVRRRHVCIASITNLLIVLPYGDAVYRGILEELPHLYSCGKVERHLHIQLCLDRRAFIPALALKVNVSKMSLIGQLEHTQRYVNAIIDNTSTHNYRKGYHFVPTGAFVDHNGGEYDNSINNSKTKAKNNDLEWSAERNMHTSVTESTTCSGRFVMRETCLYFSEGSAIQSSDELFLQPFLSKPCVLGGLGILSSHNAAEYLHTHNKIEIESITAPFSIDRRYRNTRIGALLDVSGPHMHISSHHLNMISELLREMSSFTLPHELHPLGLAHIHSPLRGSASMRRGNVTASTTSTTTASNAHNYYNSNMRNTKNSNEDKHNESELEEEEEDEEEAIKPHKHRFMESLSFSRSALFPLFGVSKRSDKDHNDSVNYSNDNNNKYKSAKKRKQHLQQEQQEEMEQVKNKTEENKLSNEETTNNEQSSTPIITATANGKANTFDDKNTTQSNEHDANNDSIHHSSMTTVNTPQTERISVDVVMRLSEGDLTVFCLSPNNDDDSGANGNNNENGVQNRNALFSRKVAQPLSVSRQVDFDLMHNDVRNSADNNSSVNNLDYSANNNNFHASRSLPVGSTEQQTRYRYNPFMNSINSNYSNTSTFTFNSSNNKTMNYSTIQDNKRVQRPMRSIMKLPLPSVQLQIVAGPVPYDRSNSNMIMARGEIRAGRIDLDPSLIIVAREIAEMADAYREWRHDARSRVMALVKEIDKNASNVKEYLHCAVMDLLIPMPRTYASHLSRQRERNIIHLHRFAAMNSTRHTTMKDNNNNNNNVSSSTSNRYTNNKNKRMAEEEWHNVHLSKQEPFITSSTSPSTSNIPHFENSQLSFRNAQKTFTNVHLSLTDFRLTFKSDSHTATTFTIFLDEHGSIDLLLTLINLPKNTFYNNINSNNNNKLYTRYPERSAILNVHRLRAECQTKLEVKSLELVLPEAAACIGLRRPFQRSTNGTMTTIAAHFPFQSEGPQPNLTIRMQHLSQAFTIAEIWTTTVQEIHKSARHLFERDAPADVLRRQVRQTHFSRQLHAETSIITGSIRDNTHTTVSESARDIRVLIALSFSRAFCNLDLGVGNSHDLQFGAGNVALEIDRQPESGARVCLILAHAADVHITSDGVLSGNARLRSALLQAFMIQNRPNAEVFVRSPENRTFRQALLFRDLSVTFKERKLRDVFECRVDSCSGNSMDGIGAEGYTTVDLDVSVHKGTLGVTPSTVPAFLSTIHGIGDIVGEQKQIAHHTVRTGFEQLNSIAAKQRMSNTKSLQRQYDDLGVSNLNINKNNKNNNNNNNNYDSNTTRQNKSLPITSNTNTSLALYEPFGETLETSSRTMAENSPLLHPPSSATKTNANVNSNNNINNNNMIISLTSPQQQSVGTYNIDIDVAPLIPFLGNALTHVPCGQLRVSLTETKILLGATSSSEGSSDCVVASCYRARMSFAECPCNDYRAVRKVLVLETNNVELYRPRPSKVVVIGLKGINMFHFYTQQTLGEAEVGYVMTLRQNRPWTGNPRFRDFEEIISLISSFTDESNIQVFQQFGKAVDRDHFPYRTSSSDYDFDNNNNDRLTSSPVWNNENTPYSNNGLSPLPMKSKSNKATIMNQNNNTITNNNYHHIKNGNSEGIAGNKEALLRTEERIASDPRHLHALRGSVFSPQLRFGGDVAVNLETILSWLGVTERMLPAVVNGQLCDRCELALSELAKVASERTFASGVGKSYNNNNNNSSISGSGSNEGYSKDAMQSPKQASPYYLQLQQRQLELQEEQRQAEEEEFARRSTTWPHPFQ